MEANATRHHPSSPVETGLPEPRASGEDLALIERLLRKDERAFSWLIDQYHSLMVRLAQTMVPTRAVAEEVVQETWQAVLERLPAFEGRSSLKTWIFRILSNRAKTRGARELRSIPLGTVAEGEDMPDPSSPVARVGSRARAPMVSSDQTPERAALDVEPDQRLGRNEKDSRVRPTQWRLDVAAGVGARCEHDRRPRPRLLRLPRGR